MLLEKRACVSIIMVSLGVIALIVGECVRFELTGFTCRHSFLDPIQIHFTTVLAVS